MKGNNMKICPACKGEFAPDSDEMKKCSVCGVECCRECTEPVKIRGSGVKPEGVSDAWEPPRDDFYFCASCLMKLPEWAYLEPEGVAYLVAARPVGTKDGFFKNLCTNSATRIVILMGDDTGRYEIAVYKEQHDAEEYILRMDRTRPNFVVKIVSSYGKRIIRVDKKLFLYSPDNFTGGESEEEHSWIR